jgi:hypothetical protein
MGLQPLASAPGPPLFSVCQSSAEWYTGPPTAAWSVCSSEVCPDTGTFKILVKADRLLLFQDNGSFIMINNINQVANSKCSLVVC